MNSRVAFPSLTTFRPNIDDCANSREIRSFSWEFRPGAISSCKMSF